MPVIEAENLTKYYGKSRGVEGVTFSVEEGEIFGFIGQTVPGRPPQ
ncbi:ABC transporter [Thermotoga neapolitana]|uniref:ABC transporter related n=1 Tax=Thermotoga neapolitana (strain ATCC 49049 / DSM 4359 / NBRC 107923 / NS-E) TaxID=309803 RepID=B9K9T2_THENN|nr:ABC transporter [Thermotoga neapolitana]ACM23715.1 ABC transporter related precursor [Thermotoga neapolitana DSM 4359]